MAGLRRDKVDLLRREQHLAMHLDGDLDDANLACAEYSAVMPSHIAEHGIWGGTSARERRLAGGRRPRPVGSHPCAGGCGKTLPMRLRCCSSTCRSRVQRGTRAA
jgi:hypothetical protein